jgi:predicted NACHT family NTPase
LFLFDGLDECGTPAKCEQVLKAIEALERSLTGTKSRFLRTVRPNAWKGDPVAAKGEYALAALTEVQVDHFIGRWYDAADRHGWNLRADSAVLVADLQQASRRPELRELAANPLLLTLMAALHTVDRLPDARADLYKEAVTLLLMRWDDKDEHGAGASLRRLLDLPHFRIERLLPALAEVAFKTHEAGDEAVHEDRLRQGFERAQTVVDYIVERTGLLSWDGSAMPRRFEFPHRSFREYLAACHLTQQVDMASRCIALTRGDAKDWARWELVLILAARIAGPERGTMLAQALVESPASSDAWTEADWLRARLAGLQLQEIGAEKVLAEPYRCAMADRVVAVLMRGAFPIDPAGSGVPAKLRSRLGDAIGAFDRIRPAKSP